MRWLVDLAVSMAAIAAQRAPIDQVRLTATSRKPPSNRGPKTRHALCTRSASARDRIDDVDNFLLVIGGH